MRRLAGTVSRLLALALTLGLADPGWAGPSPAKGRIEGRVLRSGGGGLEGVSVVLDHSAATLTDAAGRYRFRDVEAGEHRLVLTLGEDVAQEPVQVAAGEAVTVETRVDWRPAFAETITVRAASRQAERIDDAPAAITVVTRTELARQSAHGQLPKVLAGAPGIELTQSGLFDLSLNARGFNGFVNRRILTLIDGRDPSLPVFSGGQEWAALPYPLDELERAEMVRGPGAALYGPGAFNGVLNLTTRSPRDSLGGRLRLTAGELDLRRADLGWAAPLGNGGFIKVMGSALESSDFTRSRVDGAEYAGLPPEVAAPGPGPTRIASGALRFDKILGTRTLVVETGTAEIEGTTILTGAGRNHRLDVPRPWARFNLDAPHWHVLAAYTGREENGTLNLSSGGAHYLDSDRLNVELQANQAFAGLRGRLVGGASYSEQSADSSDPRGFQTLFTETVTSEHEAVFGQVEIDFSDRLKGVVSLRWDDSNLHDGELSPRVALVYGLSPRQTVRVTWGEAFQSPTLAEVFLGVAVLPPLDLSPIEEGLAPLLGGVELGFGNIPVLAVGNPALETETVRGFEVGYRGVFGKGLLITVDHYQSELESFTSGLLPVVGTSLGTLGDPVPYTPPAELSAQAAAAVLAALDVALPPSFVLSETRDGAPFIPLLTFTAFGEVETQGVELGLDLSVDGWRFDFSYTWFDFDVRSEVPEIPIAPNTPEHRMAAGVAYTGERFDVALKARWAEGFTWRSGIFVGPVPSHTVADLVASFQIRPRWKAGLSVNNLLDDEHYELFGGDILERRALVHLDLSW